MTSNLIGQGIYGCVYYPSYNCNGNISSVKKVSKIVLDNKSSRNEFKIGQYIKENIKHYEKHFIIQETMCKLNADVFSYIKGDKCKLPLNKSYLMFHSSYFNSKELSYYIKNEAIKPKQFIIWFLSICKKIVLLQKINIIHMDMHFANILVGDKMKLYIIDFGEALNQNLFFVNDTLNLQYLIDNWYYPNFTYKHLTLEYNIIGLIIKRKKEITQSVIQESIEEYYNTNTIIQFLFPEKNIYIKKAYHFFQKYETMKPKKIIKKLLKFWDTWDYYKLAIRYSAIIINYKIKLHSIIELLKIMVDPNPELRFNGKQIVTRIKNIMDNEVISKRSIKPYI